MMNRIPNMFEKCKGAMLGTAIGDALGWPNEPRAKNKSKKDQINDGFIKWVRNDRNPRWHQETIYPGEYSDDTQMTLSIARSILTGNWEEFFSKKELPFWLNYERGGGGALLKAAKSYKNGISPWENRFSKDYFNAGGNGAAMRILPHVISFANRENTHALMIEILKNTLITHGHPRAFLGATCYGYLLNYILRKNSVLEYGELVDVAINGQEIWGKIPDDISLNNWLDEAQNKCGYEYFSEWDNTCNRMVEQLNQIKNSLNRGLTINDKDILLRLNCFDETNGAGDVAILAAIYLASKYANNPVLGIKVPAYALGTDTDTIASITGGLLGMINGTSWIPFEWSFVQDHDCLVNIVDLLISKEKQDNKMHIMLEKYDWILTPIGKMRLLDVQEVPNGKNGFVVIKKWETLLGQTIYTKSFIPNNTITFPSVNSSQLNYSQKSSNNTFRLQTRDVCVLINDSGFNKKITLGKALKVINYLLNDNKTQEEIAKELKVEISFIERMKKYIKREE